MSKGLEVSILRVTQLGDLNPNVRLDAEFFRRSALEAVQEIRRGPHELLGAIASRIQHPIEVKRDYKYAGLLTVMAKNVRSNRVELSDPRFMAEELRTIVSQNKLEKGDVLVTRTGANFGQTAPWLHSVEAFACADILVVRNPSAPAGYLSSFLECNKGKPLVLRGGYGAAQPHIAPPYLANVLVPRFSGLESLVETVVDLSVAAERRAVEDMSCAQDTLLRALGLVHWKPPEPLSYTAWARDTLEAGRLDARFFAPRVRDLLAILGQDGRTIGDVATPRRQKFRSSDCKRFHYIEIGNIDGMGTAQSIALASIDAPSRATWYVEPGDLITSTVRPLRRLTAEIKLEQDGHVCSSGFVVITPHTIAPELLLTYLRLPVICELLDLYASASMYPAIDETDIFNLPIPRIDVATENQVVSKMQEARAAMAEATRGLERARRAIELAVEINEAAAITFLSRAGSTN